MEKLEFEVFSKINFYERYSALSKETRKDVNRLDKVNNKMVLPIFDSLNTKVKYILKGDFYRIQDSIENWDFNLHLSIKYGVVEVILGCKNSESGQIMGGPASLICESIEYYDGIKSAALIKKASFSTYDTLEVIFKELLSLYEDMKKEVLLCL